MEKKKFYIFEIFLMIYYAWFFLPIMRGIFNSTFFNLAFFACFFIGCALIVFEMILSNKKIIFKFNALIPVLCYMAFMAFCYLAKIGDSYKHIRVSFTFWGSIIVFYLLSNFKNSRVRLGKFLLLIFIITTITSIIGVIIDNSAARNLANAGNDENEDLILKTKNIASIYLFQGLVLFVPIILSFAEGKKTIPCIVGIFIVLIALLSASFSIALIMFFVAILLYCLLKKGKFLKYLIIFVCVALFFVIPWADIFLSLANFVKNDYISTRLKEISSLLSGGGTSGDLALRFECYTYSIQTFLKHPLGIGVHYDYIIGMNGIGYHSQFLDDLARYGVFALIFYIVFIRQYYKLLVSQWIKINKKEVVLPVVIVWFLFIVLNISFRSADESMIALFIIPIIPEIILNKKKKVQ